MAQRLIFLPGALLDAALFAQQEKFFHDQYNITIVDYAQVLRDNDVTFTIEAAVNVVLKHLGDAPVILCGHSLGGIIAQEIAALPQNKIQKLILAETTYGAGTNPIVRPFIALTALFIKLTPWRLLRWSIIREHGHSDTAYKYLSDVLSLRPIPHYREIITSALTWRGFDNLRKIDANTLILVGTKNHQTHAQGAKMARNIPNAKLVRIADASHLLMLDNPSIFNTEMAGFLDE